MGREREREGGYLVGSLTVRVSPFIGDLLRIVDRTNLFTAVNNSLTWFFNKRTYDYSTKYDGIIIYYWLETKIKKNIFSQLLSLFFLYRMTLIN